MISLHKRVAKLSFLTLLALVSILVLYSLNAFAATTINIKNYGAVPNDGIDDTAAIQSAINAIPTAGATLILPDGVYNVSSSNPQGYALTVIKNYVNIIGTNVTLKATGNFSTVLYMKGDSINIEGSNSLSVNRNDITIDGNGLANRGITVGDASTNITIKNTKVTNISQPTDPSHPLYNSAPIGIRIEGNTSMITIDNDEINNVFALNISGPSWPHKVARGILISPTSSATSIGKYITIENSYFYQIGPKDDGDGIVIQDSNEIANLSILNNTFERNYKRAIKLQVPGVTVSGNIIINNFDSSNKTETYGIDPSTEVYGMLNGIGIFKGNITVSDNTFTGSGSYYAAIEGSDSGLGPAVVKNIKVTGNTIPMGPNSDIRYSSSIRMKNIGNLYINGNKINRANFGIFLDGQNPYPIVSDNTIDGIANTGILIGNFTSHEYAQYVKITGNNITSNLFGIQIPSETVVLDLSNNQGTAGSQFIRYPGIFKFNKTYYYGYEENGSATITVTRNSPYGTVSVDYSTQGITAQAGVNYNETHGTLTFGPGETSKTFSIPLIQVNGYQGSKMIRLILSNPGGGALVSTPNQAVLITIDSDEVANLIV